MKKILLTLSCLALAFTTSYGMMVNLAVPYNPQPSKPRSPDIAFFSPTASDFLFDSSRPIKIVCQPNLRSIKLEWALSFNKVNAPIQTGSILLAPGNVFNIDLAGDKLTPGFYDLKVKIKVSDDKFLEGTTTFGWNIPKMAVHPNRPDDFDAFWKKTKEELYKIDPQPVVKLEMTLKGKEIDKYNVEHAALPESYDPEGCRFDAVEVYKVEFNGFNGQKVYAWFAKPVGKGPFPAILVVPGAGNNPRPAPVEHARHGYAAMDVQLHGEVVDNLKEQYAPVPKDDESSPLTMVHYKVYQNALQAARVLRQLPDVDPKRTAVLGGSQGGRLSVVLAGLDGEFKASIPGIAHYAYIPWLNWTKKMNEDKSNGGKGFEPPFPPFTDKNRADSYYDIINFAPAIKCPVLFNAGLIDPISSPTGVFAAYSQINSKKEMIPLPNLGHDWSPAFDVYAWRWLNKILNPPSEK